ncbi:MerR family transcriptional regulator [Marimonas arenosa]|uniref:Helix-turn-helix domain-containing protein n=1 Tax=Marimonas arenosa TaxID=1795305 RepID=A0AAE4B4U2_9RHOB|nr:helix-turn-helix domain-containing protein [Marimonas arenosa]MDQ2090590.1 helix-turn-helix domain-containing protein [Marimonas arenosa]
MFSIGDLARRTGVKVPTIRYYEQMGLVAPEGRTEGNQRRYGREGLERLAFIRHARALGLPLEAIRELIGMDPNDHARTHALAERHLANIRARIARLQGLETELERISASCAGQRGDPCTVLDAFGDHAGCVEDH